MKTNTTPIQYGADVCRRAFKSRERNLSAERAVKVPLFALVVAAWFFAPSQSFAASRWETLRAIHLVENPTNSLRVGRSGELGPYQFRPSTWKMHTKKPFHLAANRAEADVIAVKHYEWIRRGLQRNGLDATPYRIALAWNAGLTAAIRGSAPSSSHEYATRVRDLAADLQRRQLAQD